MKYADLQDYWPVECKSIYHLPLEEIRLFERTGCLHVYGEIQKAGIIEMLNKIPIRTGEFVDMGSGRGAVVAFACINYAFSKCVGIELSETRHNEALRSVEKASEDYDFSKLQLRCEDFFSYDLSNADVVYSANCAFGDMGINKMFDKACVQMKTGSFLLSMKSAGSGFKRLNLMGEISVPTSWTMHMPVYLYQLGRPFGM